MCLLLPACCSSRPCWNSRPRCRTRLVHSVREDTTANGSVHTKHRPIGYTVQTVSQFHCAENIYSWPFFCRAMLCISAAYAVMRCLSVRPSRSCIVQKRVNISSIFSPSASHIILVFPYQTLQQYISTGPLCVQCSYVLMGYEKLAIFDQYLASSLAVNGATIRCYQQCRWTVASW